MSKAENEEEQHKLLTAVYNPDVQSHSADIQQLLVSKEEVPPEQQEWSPSLDQKDPPELPHIKEEQEELLASQEGEQLRRLEEGDIYKFTFTPVTVKSEDDYEEKSYPSQLHQSQTEKNRDAEHLKTEADGKDCGGSEPDRNFYPDNRLHPDTHDEMLDSSEPETDDSCDWEETQTTRRCCQQGVRLHRADDESASEDEEPASRKRPRRMVTLEGPRTMLLSSQQPSDGARAYTANQSGLNEAGKGGAVWSVIQLGPQTWRLQSQNILIEGAGPTPHARRNIDSPVSAFMCLMDPVMLQHICECTVMEAHQSGAEGWELSLAELKAFIALLLARGVHKGRNTFVEDLWSKEWGLPFFNTTMSRNRYREIMRYLRFDRKETSHPTIDRRTRMASDRFALISEVWDRLFQNSIACYKPGPEITVDEQLLTVKTRCPFTQYMPNKPDKFGIKFWLVADVETNYMLNGYPYLGKDLSHPTTESPEESVIFKLMEPLLGNEITDNFFTSLPLVHELLVKNTSPVATTNRNKCSLPPSVHHRAGLHETKVMQSDRATLTIYQGKEENNACILNTMHTSVETGDDLKKKPETVCYYSRTEVGVLDKMLRQYSAQAASRRWPVTFFYNMLDIAALNAWVLHQNCMDTNMSRRMFILELCKELRSEYITVATEPLKPFLLSPMPEGKRKNCTVKRQCKKNKTTKVCVMCRRPVCGQCTVKVYSVCRDCE